jgi:general secretion pathway protein D
VPPPTPALPAPTPAAEHALPIAELIALGKEAYADDDWNRAQSFFEAVLRRDPYHAEAIRRLKQIADHKAGREARSYETTRTRMLETVQAAWNTPKVGGQLPAETAPAQEPSADEQQAAALRARLAALRLPAISFQDTPLQTAATELSTLCRTLDPDGKGVNLVVLGTAESSLPPITFTGTDLSALEALEILTQIAGARFEIGPNRVVLCPADYEPPQPMVTTEFDLLPSVGAKLAAGAAGDGPLDVRGFFGTVPFPPGAAAQYNPAFRVLLVRNAPQHIATVAALLEHYRRKAIEERSQQVEIETKFIEVSQGALEELGFNWTLGTPGEPVSSDTWTLPGGQQLFTDTLRTGQSALNPGIDPARDPEAFNSYSAATTDPVGTGLIDTAGEVLISKVKGDLAVDLIIRALERTAGSDLLSAPRILTRSGEPASIHVGEVRWFPTAYDVEIERYAQPSLVPLDYQEEHTGVMLEVTPELDPENGTIQLKLAPEIRELAGFDEQHVGTIWPEFGDESLDLDGAAGGDLIDFLTAREENRTLRADRLIARRPVFKTRKVQAAVTIEDGSTIAMGGLIKEYLETFQDSVPILGKIPLLGRLFRSEGQRNTKRNLLIFVTAHQVDAAGRRRATATE